MSDFETGAGIDPSHYFELLDRTHIASSYLQMALGKHPVLARHPEFIALYEAAINHLEALYQAIGQHDCDLEISSDFSASEIPLVS